jgi:hypothetical protein
MYIEIHPFIFLTLKNSIEKLSYPAVLGREGEKNQPYEYKCWRVI